MQKGDRMNKRLTVGLIFFTMSQPYWSFSMTVGKDKLVLTYNCWNKQDKV